MSGHPTPTRNGDASASSPSESALWLEAMSDEDRMFLRRFVLASGSLKAVAKSYGISYPTVRLRLDRLIQKIEVVEAHREASPFEQQIRVLYAEGRLELDTVERLLAAHRAELPPQ